MICPANYGIQNYSLVGEWTIRTLTCGIGDEMSITGEKNPQKKKFENFHNKTEECLEIGMSHYSITMPEGKVPLEAIIVRLFLNLDHP